MIDKITLAVVKSINWILSMTNSKCTRCSKCRYYDKWAFTCNEDNGYGCGVSREWERRKDGHKR